jgi:hypothetical protein
MRQRFSNILFSICGSITEIAISTRPVATKLDINFLCDQNWVKGYEQKRSVTSRNAHLPAPYFCSPGCNCAHRKKSHLRTRPETEGTRALTADLDTSTSVLWYQTEINFYEPQYFRVSLLYCCYSVALKMSPKSPWVKGLVPSLVLLGKGRAFNRQGLMGDLWGQ